MNTRDYKQFAPGEYYHVFNRGNAKADIFRDPADYALFLSRLSEALYPDRPVHGAHVQVGRRISNRKPLPAGAFSLVAFCLMPNHFHLLLGQKTELSVSALMSKVCTSYSKLFNKKYDRVGSLFQDQFKAVQVESNEQLLHLSAYIHANPKTAKIVFDASEYPYSSYREYVEAAADIGLCDKNIVLGQYEGPAAYRTFVETAFDQQVHGAHVQTFH